MKYISTTGYPDWGIKVNEIVQYERTDEFGNYIFTTEDNRIVTVRANIMELYFSPLSNYIKGFVDSLIATKLDLKQSIQLAEENIQMLMGLCDHSEQEEREDISTYCLICGKSL